MRPLLQPEGSNDLFRSRLDAIIAAAPSLVRQARLVRWRDVDAAFEDLYDRRGGPGIPTRVMVGLHYLKHKYDLSDE